LKIPRIPELRPECVMNLEISGSNLGAEQTCQAGWDLGLLMDLVQVRPAGYELRKYIKRIGFVN